MFFLTLGTGLGSAFIEGDRIIESGPRVPPRGWLFHATLDGRPLEEAFSRRALIRRYEERTGRSPDVGRWLRGPRRHRRRGGLRCRLRRPDEGLTPWLEAFDPQAIVVGGSIARSWELIERLFVPRLLAVLPGLAVRQAVLGDDAPMLGAARWVADGAG
ncbi:ROK family protein [Tessaracoccus coleopterorum]|uniref:ROK family protein n=1 Tax=Tessaracoccus coleopterorum TaxID=2714950 RepID=UPI0038CD63F1